MRISNIGIFQPSPAGTLAAGWSWGYSCVLRAQAGRGQATSPPQPLSATVHHSSTEPWGSALSLGQKGCLGSQAPRGWWGWSSLTSQQGHTACPQNRDTPFLALSLGGWLLWRDKIMLGGDAGEAEQFARL